MSCGRSCTASLTERSTALPQRAQPLRPWPWTSEQQSRSPHLRRSAYTDAAAAGHLDPPLLAGQPTVGAMGGLKGECSRSFGRRIAVGRTYGRRSSPSVVIIACPGCVCRAGCFEVGGDLPLTGAVVRSAVGERELGSGPPAVAARWAGRRRGAGRGRRGKRKRPGRAGPRGLRE